MDYKSYWEKALTIQKYNQLFEDKSNNPEAWDYGQYIPLNFARTQRLRKTFQLNPQEIQFLSETKKQYWLVISEHWCGDAAQIVPVMSIVAEHSNGQIEMKLILRDEYPELIDAHLTKGGKSVPKIIQLNTNFELLQDWGPRPKQAQKIVDEWKKDPEGKPHYAETLHKWYATDKQQRIKEELMQLIRY